MTKFVITTVQPIIRKYYVEVDDCTYAHDGIVMNEMEEYCQMHVSEDIISTQLVEEYPVPGREESINGAVMVYNYETNNWDREVMWTLK